MKNEINPKQQLIVNIIVLIVNIALVVCYFVFGKSNTWGTCIVGGITGGLYFTILQIRKCVRMMKDPEFRKQENIKANDERTLQINSEAARITGGILLVTCGAGAFISLFFDRFDYFLLFGAVVLGYSIILLITLAVLDRKY